MCYCCFNPSTTITTKKTNYNKLWKLIFNKLYVKKIIIKKYKLKKKQKKNIIYERQNKTATSRL